jgi:hypothetical protein
MKGGGIFDWLNDLYNSIFGSIFGYTDTVTLGGSKSKNRTKSNRSKKNRTRKL